MVLLVVAFDMQIELAGSGMRPIFSFGTSEMHYAALEANRDQHDAATPPENSHASGSDGAPPAPDTPDPAALPDAQDPANAPGGDAYWTDFRGPRRDGLYTEAAIRTDWPAGGLEPLWSQPVGGGYASFVVAGGRAFTIEQRRDEEVVAAYDVDSGAEIWTHTWSAHFQESMGGPGPAPRRHGTTAGSMRWARPAGSSAWTPPPATSPGNGTFWTMRALPIFPGRCPERRSSSTIWSSCSQAALAIGRSRPTTACPATSSGTSWTTCRATRRRCSRRWAGCGRSSW